MILYLSVLNERFTFAPVAQLVEHLTFNQGVRSSILRRSTKNRSTIQGASIFYTPAVANFVSFQTSFFLSLFVCTILILTRKNTTKAKDFESLRHRLAERDKFAFLFCSAEQIFLKSFGANSPQAPFKVLLFFMLLRSRTSFAFPLQPSYPYLFATYLS